LNHTTRSFLTKLKKLEQQLTIARLSDFSYPDARDALDILRTRLRQRGSQIEESETFSETTRNALLREVNYLVTRVTAIVGIIVRSASVRNAFELYAPFLEICKALVGNDVHLILSSEWEFVPFTYPQSLAELPQFIVIGLPASESDNVLIFPAAGHELGHSVWSKHLLGDSLKSNVESRVNDAFRRNRAQFDSVYPELRGANLDQDMFVQYVKSEVFSSILSQSEETFSDFLGMVLFGESYLLAFEYLIAPQISGGRVKHYPDTRARAERLNRFAREKLKIVVENYSNAFAANTPFRMPHDNFICAMADEVIAEIDTTLFSEVESIVSRGRVPTPADQTNGILIVPAPEKTGAKPGRSNSIDFRLGRWFLAIQQSRTTAIDLHQERESEEFEASEGKMHYVPFGRQFVIHPGRFVLGATLEWIRVPETLGGYITGRSSMGRRGLIIETAAGLHPCFSGCITLEISNVGEVPIALFPGMRICQIFFHKVSRRSAQNETSFGRRGKPTFGDYAPDKLVVESRRQYGDPDQNGLFEEGD
jgi:dCTP deaminase